MSRTQVGPTGGSRRGFLGWMGRVGVGAVGVVAGLGATAEAASGAHGCHYYGCCCLALATRCSGGSGFKCPSGYYRRTWSCCSPGVGNYGCGECTKSSGCNGRGPYYCSVGWFYGGPNCFS